MRPNLAACGGLGLWTFAACAAPPPSPPPVDLSPFHALRAEDFPGAVASGAGFDFGDGARSMRVGDEALLAVAVHRGGGVSRQLVHLRVQDLLAVSMPGGIVTRPVQSWEVTETDAEGVATKRQSKCHPIRLHMRRMAADGRELAVSTPQLHEEMLTTGWWPYAVAKSSRAEWDLALGLTMTVQNLATSDPLLQELLFEIVDRPSVWSIATNLGVKVSIRFDPAFEPPELVPVVGLHEVRRAAIELRVNGSIAAWIELLVSEPAGGTFACGGLVGAIVRHPTETGRFAVVRLLGARRSGSVTR